MHRRSACDRDKLERRPQEALYGRCCDHGTAFGISLVVLLDLREIVEVVDHQTVALGDCLLRFIGHPVDTLGPAAVTGVETPKRIGRPAGAGCGPQEIPWRRSHQWIAECLC